MDRLVEMLISFGEVDPQSATDIARMLFSKGVTVGTLKNVTQADLVSFGVTSRLDVQRVLTVRDGIVSLPLAMWDESIMWFVSHYFIETATEALICWKYAKDRFRNRRVVLDTHKYPLDLRGLMESIQTSQNFVLVLSKGYVRDAVCMVELVTAWKAKIRILPVAPLFMDSSRYNLEDLGKDTMKLIEGSDMTGFSKDWDAMLAQIGYDKTDVIGALTSIVHGGICFNLHATQARMRQNDLREIFGESDDQASLVSSSSSHLADSRLYAPVTNWDDANEQASLTSTTTTSAIIPPSFPSLAFLPPVSTGLTSSLRPTRLFPLVPTRLPVPPPSTGLRPMMPSGSSFVPRSYVHPLVGPGQQQPLPRDLSMDSFQATSSQHDEQQRQALKRSVSSSHDLDDERAKAPRWQQHASAPPIVAVRSASPALFPADAVAVRSVYMGDIQPFAALRSVPGSSSSAEENKNKEAQAKQIALAAEVRATRQAEERIAREKKLADQEKAEREARAQIQAAEMRKTEEIRVAKEKVLAAKIAAAERAKAEGAQSRTMAQAQAKAMEAQQTQDEMVKAAQREAENKAQANLKLKKQAEEAEAKRKKAQDIEAVKARATAVIADEMRRRTEEANQIQAEKDKKVAALAEKERLEEAKQKQVELEKQALAETKRLEKAKQMQVKLEKKALAEKKRLEEAKQKQVELEKQEKNRVEEAQAKAKQKDESDALNQKNKRSAEDDKSKAGDLKIARISSSASSTAVRIPPPPSHPPPNVSDGSTSSYAPKAPLAPLTKVDASLAVKPAPPSQPPPAHLLVSKPDAPSVTGGERKSEAAPFIVARRTEFSSLSAVVATGSTPLDHVASQPVRLVVAKRSAPSTPVPATTSSPLREASSTGTVSSVVAGPRSSLQSQQMTPTAVQSVKPSNPAGAGARPSPPPQQMTPTAVHSVKPSKPVGGGPLDAEKEADSFVPMKQVLRKAFSPAAASTPGSAVVTTPLVVASADSPVRQSSVTTAISLPAIVPNKPSSVAAESSSGSQPTSVASVPAATRTVAPALDKSPPPHSASQPPVVATRTSVSSEHTAPTSLPGAPAHVASVPAQLSVIAPTRTSAPPSSALVNGPSGNASVTITLSNQTAQTVLPIVPPPAASLLAQDPALAAMRTTVPAGSIVIGNAGLTANRSEPACLLQTESVPVQPLVVVAASAPVLPNDLSHEQTVNNVTPTSLPTAVSVSAVVTATRTHPAGIVNGPSSDQPAKTLIPAPIATSVPAVVAATRTPSVPVAGMVDCQSNEQTAKALICVPAASVSAVVAATGTPVLQEGSSKTVLPLPSPVLQREDGRKRAASVSSGEVEEVSPVTKSPPKPFLSSPPFPPVVKKEKDLSKSVLHDVVDLSILSSDEDEDAKPAAVHTGVSSSSQPAAVTTDKTMMPRPPAAISSAPSESASDVVEDEYFALSRARQFAALIAKRDEILASMANSQSFCRAVRETCSPVGIYFSAVDVSEDVRRENRLDFGMNGGCALLVEILRKYGKSRQAPSIPSQVFGVMECIGHEKTNAGRFFDAGACDAIVDVWRAWKSHPIIVDKALAVVCNQTQHGLSRMRFGELDVPDLVSEALRNVMWRTDRKLVWNAVSAVRNLTDTNEENCVKFFSTGQPIVDVGSVLAASVNEAGMCEDGFGALRNLVTTSSDRPLPIGMISRQFLHTLVQALDQWGAKNAPIALQGCGFFSKLASRSEPVRAMLKEMKAAKVFMRCMENECKDKVLKILSLSL